MTRKEAIAMIEDDKKRHHDELSGSYRAALTMAIEALEQEQKRGKWLFTPVFGNDCLYPFWECSECGHRIFVPTEEEKKKDYAFCGRCGARMESDKE